MYLRARYYDPGTGRFLSEDPHWNPENMIFGDNPVKWNERESDPDDPLGLNAFTYKPDINAIMQSGNLYAYCMNNPLNYTDPGGEFVIALAAVPFIVKALIVVATAATAAYLGCVTGSYIGYQIRKSNDKGVQHAFGMLAFASTAATPPPPNDPRSKGTRTTSTTLYDRNGTHVDVENPGNRLGQIHLQQNGVKYYYNIQTQTFRIGSSTGQLAPKAIQDLINIGDIAKAIAKGLTYLGY